jgi:hypothetical protein
MLKNFFVGTRVSTGQLSPVVIASQRVRAKRGTMTGSAKQSVPELAAAWIASSLALLAMTKSEP